MKAISLDFKNNMICIMTAGQQGTETNRELRKVAFNSFIPEQFRDRNSFTWDFENETFAVNQDYELHEGCIMTKDCFIPEIMIPMAKLSKRYDEFVAIMGYEEVDLESEITSILMRFLNCE